MKLCNVTGNGVCINCNHTPPNGRGDICRYMAELYLECFEAFLHTELTKEQQEIYREFFCFIDY